MYFFIWIIYGLITTLIVWELFPLTPLGGSKAFIFLIAFALLGALDYFASKKFSSIRKFRII